MQLTIDNQIVNFIPLATFRSQWGLPPEFNLAYFEPKDWQGLGRLDGSGPTLALVRQQVLESVPPTITLPNLPPHIQELSNTFSRELTAINSHIGLRLVEVEFAVAGFADVLQNVAYTLIQLSHTHRHDSSQIRRSFDFLAVYQNWLDASARIAVRPHRYLHQDRQFEVYLVYNAYGRVGLKIETAGEIYYVADPALACPAASYMQELCAAVAEKLCAALTGSPG